MSTTGEVHVSVLLFDYFSNHCLANAVEPLRAANTLSEKRLFSWQFLTPDGRAVRSSSDLPVQPSGKLGRDGGGDYLLLLPSYRYLGHDDATMRRSLRAAAGRYGAVVGLDTGAWLMASAGLLDGIEATIHWDEFSEFSERFPDVQARPARYVIAGNRITCGGAAATFELVIELIQRRFGAALALNVGALFMHGEWPAQMAHDLPVSGRGRVDRATALMRRHIEHPLAISDIAGQVAVTQRMLESEFRQYLKMSPSAAYRQLRLEAARRLLETGQDPVSEVATRCGWADHSAFARAFRQQFSMTPREWRLARCSAH
ncbi:GlxA family transcriptional regulator [Paracoccus sp. Z330]|uniref:GlxA family transcriptional regulator n=1 Tax=Paracoccus onchidii TaxID=3017813 RepID=A0ABT4ZH61_9RHOB|nr:GlxA family transcriptional regulator [Paracoccus onchidii]MDB6178313.1 GlxA family transcriptional regulator [Paracoccus onchidii]